MALIVTNHAAAKLRPAERQQAYNCLDACLTPGIARALLPQLGGKASSERTYTFERAMQAPAMTMALRGIAVDEAAARIEVGRLLNLETHTIRRLRLLASVWTESGTTDFSTIRNSLEAGSMATGLDPGRVLVHGDSTQGHRHGRRLHGALESVGPFRGGLAGQLGEKR